LKRWKGANQLRRNTTINPNNYDFSFQLGPYDCYKVRTGMCSLNLSPEEVLEVENVERDNYKAGLVSYCRTMSLCFDDNNIVLKMNSCGHISFIDGQHRTCIARRKKMEVLNCVISNTNRPCPSCRSRNEDCQLITS